MALAQDNADRTGAIATPSWELEHAQAEHNIEFIGLETWRTFLREEEATPSTCWNPKGLEGGIRGWGWAGGSRMGTESLREAVPSPAACPPLLSALFQTQDGGSLTF